MRYNCREKERGKRSNFLNSFFFKTTGGELTVVTTSSFLWDDLNSKQVPFINWFVIIEHLSSQVK